MNASTLSDWQKCSCWYVFVALASSFHSAMKPSPPVEKIHLGTAFSLTGSEA